MRDRIGAIVVDVDEVWDQEEKVGEFGFVWLLLQAWTRIKFV